MFTLCAEWLCIRNNILELTWKPWTCKAIPGKIKNQSSTRAETQAKVCHRSLALNQSKIVRDVPFLWVTVFLFTSLEAFTLESDKISVMLDLSGAETDKDQTSSNHNAEPKLLSLEDSDFAGLENWLGSGFSSLWDLPHCRRSLCRTDSFRT